VVVVTAGRDERGLVAEPAGELEAERALVERECAVEVRDLEVDVADVGSGVERRGVELEGLRSGRHVVLRVIRG
jgi:hypothetical protein